VSHVGRTPSHYSHDRVRIRTTTAGISSVLAVENLPLTYVSDSVDRRLVFVYALAFPNLPMTLGVALLLSMLVTEMVVGTVGVFAKAPASSRVLKEPERCQEMSGN
jgi:hypothetical protein